MNRSKVAMLSALPGITLAELHAAQVPSRFKLLNWGENPTVKGNFIVNETTLAALPANQRSLGFDAVALDFEHNTVPGTPEYERSHEPRPVAAFGSIEVVRNEGVYLNVTDWRKADARKEYKDLSPTVGTNSSGEVTFVHSVALCRNGAVHGLTIENATALSAIFSDKQTAPTKPNNSMSNLTLAHLAALIGLSADATEETVKQHFTKLASAQTPKLTTLSVTINGKTEQLTPEQLAQRLVDLEGKLTTLNTSVTQEKRDALVARFAAEGRVPLKADGVAYTQDELKALDMTLLTSLVVNTPATVPLNARTGNARGVNAAVDAAKADRVRARASELHAANPKRQFQACWTQAEAEIK